MLAVCLIGFGVPLAQRRVKPNLWYGLRVPATFADEYVWYEANAMAGRDFVALGVLLALLVVVLPVVVPLASSVYPLIFAVVLGGGSMVSTIRTWRYANRLRRERQAR